MDADFSEKLKNVLSDPEALSKITAIASSLGASQPSELADADPETQNQNGPPVSLTPVFQSDPRLALLSSVKPLLRQEKQNRVDALLNALTIANVMKNLRK